jgi:hypothetical protein
MPRKTVSLTITTEDVDALNGAFGSSNGSGPLSDSQLQTVAQLALIAWLDLFGGRKQFRSLTELQLHGLNKIYAELLVDEAPSETRLFSQLGFGYGQAVYLARVLRQQRNGAWRKQALVDLGDALGKRLDESKQWIKDGRGAERMNFIISKASRIELEIALGNLLGKGVLTLSPIRLEGRMGTHVSLTMVAEDLEQILGEVKRLAGGA